MKVGIVGCGNIAKIHLKIIKKHIESNNIAICDKDVLRAEHLAKEFNIESVYTDLSVLLNEYKPDVVQMIYEPILDYMKDQQE